MWSHYTMTRSYRARSLQQHSQRKLCLQRCRLADSQYVDGLLPARLRMNDMQLRDCHSGVLGPAEVRHLPYYDGSRY